MFYNWFRLISLAIIFPSLSVSISYLFFHLTSFFDLFSIIFNHGEALFFTIKIVICVSASVSFLAASSVFIFSGDSTPAFLNGFFPGACEFMAE